MLDCEHRTNVTTAIHSSKHCKTSPVQIRHSLHALSLACSTSFHSLRKLHTQVLSGIVTICRNIRTALQRRKQEADISTRTCCQRNLRSIRWCHPLACQQRSRKSSSSRFLHSSSFRNRRAVPPRVHTLVHALSSAEDLRGSPSERHVPSTALSAILRHHVHSRSGRLKMVAVQAANRLGRYSYGFEEGAGSSTMLMKRGPPWQIRFYAGS